VLTRTLESGWVSCAHGNAAWRVAGSLCSPRFGVVDCLCLRDLRAPLLVIGASPMLDNM